MIYEKNLYEKLAIFTKKYFSWFFKNNGKTDKKFKKYISKDFIDSLNFSCLDVKPDEILILSYTFSFVSFIVFFLIDIFILFIYKFDLGSIDFFTILLMVFLPILIPMITLNVLFNYPRTFAKYKKIHSLGDIPEITSYIVMYLKLVSNLENSAKFAATESNTSLALDLRKMLWDMEIRIHHGIDDALTSYANQWGKWSEYFKRSIHLIRSSIQERDESSRTVTLNRALDVVLEGTKDTMNKFANKLDQPTMVIYSIGIMIPLSLVAMLPALGLVGMKVNIIQIFFLYDVILPFFILFYIRKILLSRPATFNPPKIPIDHPDLISINKNRRLFVSLLIGSFVALPGIIFLFIPRFFPSGSSNLIINYIIDSDGLNSIFPVTLFIIWGVAASVSIYCFSVYVPYKKIRDDIKQIEEEFSDALYILGKRISEEKSPEESFMYASYIMEGSKISEVFSKTGYNLTAMHSNLSDALFSKEYGSLKYVYSDRVKAIMKLFVEGISKSQKAVSISIIRIADHLKELQSVEKKIKDSLFQLTSTLRSTVAVFAPLIGGITLAITKLITKILGDLSGNLPYSSSEQNAISNIPVKEIASSFDIDNVSPEFFVLVIGIYIIELVFLLVKFSNGIDEGDDKATYMYSLGKIMPTSIIVFSITIIIGQFFFSSIVRV